jgi:hypothetical protein
MKTNTAERIVFSGGVARFVYSDGLLDLAGELHGRRTVSRASHVEPTADGRGWTADMSPVEPGVVLGPFPTRSEGLAAERAWLRTERGL